MKEFRRRRRNYSLDRDTIPKYRQTRTTYDTTRRHKRRQCKLFMLTPSRDSRRERRNAKFFEKTSTASLRLESTQDALAQMSENLEYNVDMCGHAEEAINTQSNIFNYVWVILTTVIMLMLTQTLPLRVFPLCVSVFCLICGFSTYVDTSIMFFH